MKLKTAMLLVNSLIAPILLMTSCTQAATEEEDIVEQIPIESQVIAFRNKNLETIIKNTLGKPSDEEILSTDLAKLNKLSIQNNNVFDLTGLGIN